MRQEHDSWRKSCQNSASGVLKSCRKVTKIKSYNFFCKNTPSYWSSSFSSTALGTCSILPSDCKWLPIHLVLIFTISRRQLFPKTAVLGIPNNNRKFLKLRSNFTNYLWRGSFVIKLQAGGVQLYKRIILLPAF